MPTTITTTNAIRQKNGSIEQKVASCSSARFFRNTLLLASSFFRLRAADSNFALRAWNSEGSSASYAVIGSSALKSSGLSSDIAAARCRMSCMVCLGAAIQKQSRYVDPVSTTCHSNGDVTATVTATKSCYALKSVTLSCSAKGDLDNRMLKVRTRRPKPCILNEHFHVVVHGLGYADSPHTTKLRARIRTSAVRCSSCFLPIFDKVIWNNRRDQ
mmetsp:Transcript_559/g.1000  ORF Transcript_559/g.1000 Transcript_559/m.1000 type:complete len:215 (+) Transcript_559:158-802(+)